MQTTSRVQLCKELDLLEIFRLRRDGHSVEDIARKLVIPPMRVRVVLADSISVISEQTDNLRKEVFALDLSRLDVATKAIMPAVEKGELGAVNTLLKVQRRRAEMLGLDAPKEVISHNFNQDRPRSVGEMSSEELHQIVVEGECVTVPPRPPRYPSGSAPPDDSTGPTAR